MISCIVLGCWHSIQKRFTIKCSLHRRHCGSFMKEEEVCNSSTSMCNSTAGKDNYFSTTCVLFLLSWSCLYTYGIYVHVGGDNAKYRHTKGENAASRWRVHFVVFLLLRFRRSAKSNAKTLQSSVLALFRVVTFSQRQPANSTVIVSTFRLFVFQRRFFPLICQLIALPPVKMNATHAKSAF